MTSNNTERCTAAGANCFSDKSAAIGSFTGVGNGVVGRAGGWVRDLTCEGVEPNPGPPSGKGDDDEKKRKQPEESAMGAGGAGGHAEAEPSTKKHAVALSGEGGDRLNVLLGKVTSLETSKEFWQQQIQKKTMDDDTVGAAEAKIDYHDIDMQLHETKAQIARANGNHEEAQKEEMAKNKADMAKNKAEMAKGEAKMAKAKAAGDTEGEQLAREEIQRAKAEYDAAKKVHDALLEQVTGTHRRKEMTPIQFTGDEIVDMSADNILVYFRKQQRQSGAVNTHKNIHSKEDLTFQLAGRQSSLEVIQRHWSNMRKHYVSPSQYSESDTGDITPSSMQSDAVSPTKDRTKFPVLVCCGMPGLGKSRLLEESKQMFDVAGITGLSLAIIVMYGNGHKLNHTDHSLPVEASFSWRLLHWVFLEDNGPAFTEWFRETLPHNASKLTLRTALKVVHVAATSDSVDGTVSLSLGVDEYQEIMKLPHRSDDPYDSPMQQVLDAIVGCCNDPIPGLHIYTMFAGTEWTKFVGITSSSNADTRRVPLPLLSSRDMETAVSSTKYRSHLSSTMFRRLLFALGGVPRFCVEFTEAVKNASPAEEISRAFNVVWEDRVCRAWKFRVPDLIKLAAHALSGQAVDPATCPGIGPFVEGAPPNWSWARLSDMGVCLLDQVAEESHSPDASPKRRVRVPYCVLRMCAALDDNDGTSLTEKALIQNLQYMRDHVDAVMFDHEPWQQWEVFGACFHALRINALQIVSPSESVVCPFSTLVTGAVQSGCDANVLLQPMKVFATSECYSATMPCRVPERHNPTRTANWVDGDDEYGYVVINGPGGQGVDVFFALKTPTGNSRVVCVDQRKRVAGSLGHGRAAALVSKARVKPDCLPHESHVYVGLFSLFASYNQAADLLPNESFAVSDAQQSMYHGVLDRHPASSPVIDINRDNVSTLRQVPSLRDAVDRIVERRRANLFHDSQALDTFLSSLNPPVALDVSEKEWIVVHG